MMADFDTRLRETMRRLAQTPAPPNLAEAAMRRGRRQRRTRTALGAAAAVVVVAAATPVVLNAWPARQGIPAVQAIPATTTPVATPGESTRPPLVVTAYADPLGESFHVLDPDTGEYVEIPYRDVVPSPDGTRLLVNTGLGTPADPYRTGVLDRATMDVRWIDGYAGTATWSPDGQEILVTSSSQAFGSGFAIVDATTLTGSYRQFPLYGNPLVWTPDGQQLAITVTEATGDEREADRVVGINFHDRDGQLVRTLPVDTPLHATHDFSPDGTSMALYHYYGNQIRVVDVATGSLLHEIVLTEHVADILAWVDDSHLLVRAVPGLDQPAHMSIVDLSGTVVETIELPGEAARVEQVWVGSAEGLSEAAEHLAF